MKYWQLYWLMAMTVLAPHFSANFAFGMGAWWDVLAFIYMGKDR